MSSFNWQTAQAQFPATRYAQLLQGDVLGLAEWERFIYRFPYPNPESAWPYLHALHQAKLSAPTRKCPRVFVSHKQVDVAEAKRIAWLIQGQQIDYWLDVIDLPPALTALTASTPAFNTTLLIAAMIEMALINCTHVLAVMTSQTATSRWVPYEYGRIKDDPPGRLTASCWHHPDLTWSDLPEYLHLAPIHDSEMQIINWLQAEKPAFPRCHWELDREWQGGDTDTKPLPEHPRSQHD
jgi:hypothetical protein